MALGTPRITSLDEATVNQLQTLRDLYFRPTEDNPVNIRSSRPLPDHQREKRPADSDEGQLESKRVEQNGFKWVIIRLSRLTYWVGGSDPKWVLPKST